MERNDREPVPHALLTGEWNGSRILIEDIDAVVRSAHERFVTLHEDHRLPGPIDRLTMMAGPVRTRDAPDALEFMTIIAFDKTSAYTKDFINDRLRDGLSLNSPTSTSHHRRSPFLFGSHDLFVDAQVITDEEFATRYLLWHDKENSRLILTNDGYVHGDDKELRVAALDNATVPIADQLISFSMATAMVADFVNAFSLASPGDRIQGVPLNKEYTLRVPEVSHVRERRSRHLGEHAVRDTVNGTIEQPLGMASEITLENVGGLAPIKKILKDIALSFSYPEVMEKWGAQRPQGVLLHGAPGTGKTLLANAFAGEIGARIEMLQSSDIYERWLGESTRHIKEIFMKARQAKSPLVLFFDEFETIVGITGRPSSGGADTERNAVAGLFKQEMNTLSRENPNVIVFAATNHVDRIDQSLIRSGRFDYKIHVPMPDREARQDIIDRLLYDGYNRPFQIYANDVNARELSELSEGLSGADLTEVLRRLRLVKAAEDVSTSRSPSPISQSEIIHEVRTFVLPETGLL